MKSQKPPWVEGATDVETAYPPSDVCQIDASARAISPYVLCQIIVPVELSFTTASFGLIQPAKTYPPSNVGRIDVRAAFFAVYSFCQTTFPPPSSLRTQLRVPPPWPPKSYPPRMNPPSGVGRTP